MNVSADVVRFDAKIEGRRTGCDSNFCFLESARTNPWPGEFFFSFKYHNSYFCCDHSLLQSSALFFGDACLLLFKHLFLNVGSFLND